MSKQFKPTWVKRGEYRAAPEVKAGETGDPRENTPNSGFVWHVSHIRKSGSDPTGNQTRADHTPCGPILFKASKYSRIGPADAASEAAGHLLPTKTRNSPMEYGIPPKFLSSPARIERQARLGASSRETPPSLPRGGVKELRRGGERLREKLGRDSRHDSYQMAAAATTGKSADVKAANRKTPLPPQLPSILKSNKHLFFITCDKLLSWRIISALLEACTKTRPESPAQNSADGSKAWTTVLQRVKEGREERRSHPLPASDDADPAPGEHQRGVATWGSSRHADENGRWPGRLYPPERVKTRTTGGRRERWGYRLAEHIPVEGREDLRPVPTKPLQITQSKDLHKVRALQISTLSSQSKALCSTAELCSVQNKKHLESITKSYTYTLKLQSTNKGRDERDESSSSRKKEAVKRREKREISEKTHQPAASSGTIPTCEYPGSTPTEIEPKQGDEKKIGSTLTRSGALMFFLRYRHRFTLSYGVYGYHWTAFEMLFPTTIDSELQCQTVSPDIVIIGFSELPPTMVANLKTYSRQNGYLHPGHGPITDTKYAHPPARRAQDIHRGRANTAAHGLGNRKEEEGVGMGGHGRWRKNGAGVCVIYPPRKTVPEEYHQPLRLPGSFPSQDRGSSVVLKRLAHLPSTPPLPLNLRPPPMYAPVPGCRLDAAGLGGATRQSRRSYNGITRGTPALDGREGLLRTPDISVSDDDFKMLVDGELRSYEDRSPLQLFRISARGKEKVRADAQRFIQTATVVYICKRTVPGSNQDSKRAYVFKS
ncbi:hypothetical protein PR048_024989 [Dryococelus australis]|uniref:Uncharacterized protein n=1 Tax=Dryococelus australis TaxID=614101 RepID=A0ABQ9GQ61_9NEOP|nr:hypothetical protein PR048_024989 [Dryococelus australis]